MSMSRHMLVVLGIGIVFGLAQATVVADTTAFWEFNNTLADSSGNGHHGAATNSGLGVNYVTDGGTTALLQATGISDVTIPGSSQFQFSGDGGYTIEARVKLNSGGYNLLIDGTAAGGGPGWFLRSTNAGFLQSDAYDGAGEREVSGTTNVNDGAWHHVAVVFNGSTDALTLYVDYAQEGYVDYTNDVALTSLIGTSSDIRIGTNHTANLPCNGEIDYIRVSNVALAPSQFVGVPEPSAVILLATGLLGLLAYVWRKRR
jgi:hypothetical protein